MPDIYLVASNVIPEIEKILQKNVCTISDVPGTIILSYFSFIYPSLLSAIYNFTFMLKYLIKYRRNLTQSFYIHLSFKVERNYKI